jgi:acetyl-CoA acetyltransferase
MQMKGNADHGGRCSGRGTASLSIHDMEALHSGNLMQAAGMVGQGILQEIGQTGIPVTNCANACATGATALREAWTAIW